MCVCTSFFDVESPFCRMADDQQYSLNAIKGYRFRSEKIEYHLEWDTKEQTWEPKSCFEGVPVTPLLENFWYVIRQTLATPIHSRARELGAVFWFSPTREISTTDCQRESPMQTAKLGIQCQRGLELGRAVARAIHTRAFAPSFQRHKFTCLWCIITPP